MNCAAVPDLVRGTIRGVQPWLRAAHPLVVAYTVGVVAVVELGVMVKPKACGE